MTRNDCYTAQRKITPKGIMVHSTATPGVMAASWFSRWNKSFKAKETNRQVCVHAFLDDEEICQYLPWNHRGWHAGKGTKGSANDTHIGFEICEPGGFSYGGGSNMVGYDIKKNEQYFRAAWSNAVDLCVHLCKTYGLTEKEIICHSEGNKMGNASNHGDVMHWFPKHGESMDSFRAAVKMSLVGTPVLIEVFDVGDIVEFKSSATKYYPGGPGIPSWVKETQHKVTQIESGGKPVIKAGRKCVLLGKIVSKTSKQETEGIMTWVDSNELTLIDRRVSKPTNGSSEQKLYHIQVGAYRQKDYAEALMDQLKKAGFKAYLKYE